MHNSNADLVFEEILKRIQCPVCLDLFREPRRIFCGHTFCHDCLKQSLTNKRECPSCRSSTYIEYAQVDQLADSLVSQLKDLDFNDLIEKSIKERMGEKEYKDQAIQVCEEYQIGVHQIDHYALEQENLAAQVKLEHCPEYQYNNDNDDDNDDEQLKVNQTISSQSLRIKISQTIPNEKPHEIQIPLQVSDPKLDIDENKEKPSKRNYIRKQLTIEEYLKIMMEKEKKKAMKQEDQIEIPIDNIDNVDNQDEDCPNIFEHANSLMVEQDSKKQNNKQYTVPNFSKKQSSTQQQQPIQNQCQVKNTSVPEPVRQILLRSISPPSQPIQATESRNQRTKSSEPLKIVQQDASNKQKPKLAQIQPKQERTKSTEPTVNPIKKVKQQTQTHKPEVDVYQLRKRKVDNYKDLKLNNITQDMQDKKDKKDMKLKGKQQKTGRK